MLHIVARQIARKCCPYYSTQRLPMPPMSLFIGIVNIIILWKPLLFNPLSNFQVCGATGRVNVQLLSYENSQSRDSSGSCCDFPCSNPCDNYFRLCFAKPGSGSRCSLWDKKTKHLGYDTFKFPGDLGNNIKNPFVHRFTKWEVGTIIHRSSAGSDYRERPSLPLGLYDGVSSFCAKNRQPHYEFRGSKSAPTLSSQ